MTARLDIRAPFRALDRRPRVYFYTTSDEKFLQARYVFTRSGLPLKHFRSKTDPYSENEGEGTERLLKAAIQEIKESIGESSFFFVEDTSVVIDALSLEGDLFPGLRVKQWFAETSFAELDAVLRKHDCGRTAQIRSDIALHVPQLERPIRFTGEVQGAIATDPPDFPPDPQHPWLGPHTFSAWFVPNGATRTLGAMAVEESLRFDFRARAFTALVDRLEEYSAALNLPSSGYQRRPRDVASGHPELFTDDRTGFLVIGPTCAGKTTFAERATRHDLVHIEASSVVRSLGEPRPGESAAEFAKRLLDEMGADVVARRAVEWFEEIRQDRGFVISGFRTIEELLAIKEVKQNARVVLVEASPRIRLERYLERLRDGEPITLTGLAKIDAEQAEFGLLAVASQLPDIRIRNEETLEQYHEVVDALVDGVPIRRLRGVSSGPARADLTERGQLERCAHILVEAGRPLSTDEIEERSVATGSRIRHNNANKVLKRYPALIERLEGGAGRLRYQARPAATAYLRYLSEFAMDRQVDSH